MANEFIGRRASIGIGKETTSGTSVAATFWVPKTSGWIKAIAEKAIDDGGYWVIDERYDSQTVKQMTETPLEGIVRDIFIGALLHATFWTDAVSTVSGAYQHAFTRLNSNTHPSYTIHEYDPVQSYYSAYSMVDSFEISAEAGDYVKFSAVLKWKKKVSETAPTVAFVTENDFRASHVNVYFDDTEAGLASATATKVKSFKLTINKNLIDYQALGSDDVDSFFNQHFTIAGDLEALYNTTTLYDLFKASTKKFMKIAIVNTDVTIGTAKNPTLEFIFGKVSVEERDKSQDNNGIVMQTLWFDGEFNNTAGYTVKANLLNTRTTVY